MYIFLAAISDRYILILFINVAKTYKDIESNDNKLTSVKKLFLFVLRLYVPFFLFFIFALKFDNIRTCFKEFHLRRQNTS